MATQVVMGQRQEAEKMVTVSGTVTAELYRVAKERLDKDGCTMSHVIEGALVGVLAQPEIPAPPGTECSPEEHDAWFRAEVQKELDDPSGDISSEEADRIMAAHFASARKAG